MMWRGGDSGMSGMWYVAWWVIWEDRLERLRVGVVRA